MNVSCFESDCFLIGIKKERERMLSSVLEPYFFVRMTVLFFLRVSTKLFLSIGWKKA